MFDILKSIFSGDTEEKIGNNFGPDDLRLAEAALLFHVIQADGAIVEAERIRMHKVLTDEYQLSEDQMEDLFAAAKNADEEAIDLYRFTSLLKRNLDRAHLVQIVEHLWEMVFADGIIHELEDNVVWRVAELLEIETQERMEMKRRVRVRRGL